MSFYRETLVKSVRKSRSCCGCGKQIEAGQPALDCAGHYQGDFWADSYHLECRAAECEINDLHGCEEWMQLSEIETDDWEWLLEDHPIVAERMGITRARLDEAIVRQQQARRYWPRAAQ